MIPRMEIKSERLYIPSKPVRDQKYLRFVKSFPCASCGKSWGVDPAHTGPHGISTKSSDLSTIPLCRKCHDQFDPAPRDFAILHGLDVPALITRLNRAYELVEKRRIA